MSLKAALAVLVALAGSSSARSVHAEETAGEWIPLAQTDDYEWHGKRASGAVGSLDGVKNAGYSYVYQVRNKQKNTYEYAKIALKLESCKKGYGYVYYNDMDGKYLSKRAFVRFGGTVADALGSTGCTSWDSDTRTVSRQYNDNTWELAAQGDKSGVKYSLKTDTVRKRKHNGNPAITALYSFEDTKVNTTYSEYAITTADCKRGYGTIHELDLDGALIEKNDVVLSGHSVISSVAKALCAKA